MFNNRTFVRSTLGLALLVTLLFALASCGGGSDNNKTVPTPQRVTATPAATLTRTPIPTWTPSNTPALLSTSTPGPTFTPRPSASATPQPVTGAQRSGQDQTIVTVLEPDLNVSITNMYIARGLASLPAAPAISMRQQGWLEIQFTFHNEFMGGDSQVNTIARLSARDGQIVMSESRSERQVQGVMIDEELVNMVLDLVLQGVNDIVVNLVPAPAGSYKISSVTSYPGYLQVIVT